MNRSWFSGASGPMPGSSVFSPMSWKTQGHPARTGVDSERARTSWHHWNHCQRIRTGCQTNRHPILLLGPPPCCHSGPRLPGTTVIGVVPRAKACLKVAALMRPEQLAFESWNSTWTLARPAGADLGLGRWYSIVQVGRYRFAGWKVTVRKMRVQRQSGALRFCRRGDGGGFEFNL